MGDFLQKQFSDDLRGHLSKVYFCMATTTTASAIGAYLCIATGFFPYHLLLAVIEIILIIALSLTANEQGENFTFRYSLLTIFGFINGLSLGPLLNYATTIDPILILSAFVATSLIFAAFSAIALFSDKSAFLCLGGPLCGISLALVGLAILNIFFQSEALFKLDLYVGLAVLNLYILFDTQVIIDKYQNGSKDIITHTIGLFLDFAGIFVRILIILLQNRPRRGRDDDQQQ